MVIFVKLDENDLESSWPLTFATITSIILSDNFLYYIILHFVFFSGISECGYSMCEELHELLSDNRIKIGTPSYSHLRQLIRQGDDHVLDHTVMSRRPNSLKSILDIKYRGISDQSVTIQNATKLNREGKQPLSEVLVHRANLFMCDDSFSFIFKYQTKEEGVTQTTGSFKTETGQTYTQRWIEARFGIGYFSTLIPNGEGYDSEGKCCGMFKEIRTHDHYKKMYPNQEENPQEPFKEAQKKYQEYLEKVTDLEKQCHQDWESLAQSREAKRSRGEDPWWPWVKPYKWKLKEAGSEDKEVIIYCLPLGLGTKTMPDNTDNPPKHRTTWPKPRQTPCKRLCLDKEWCWGVFYFLLSVKT